MHANRPCNKSADLDAGPDTHAPIRLSESLHITNAAPAVETMALSYSSSMESHAYDCALSGASRGIMSRFPTAGGLAAAAVLSCVACLTTDATAQQPPPDPSQGTRLRVFLDCQRCDFDHLRREVGFVDYVRDPADAQIHVLVTSQETGGGGDEFTLYFIGQGRFAADQDTLRFATRQDDTEEEERVALTRTFSLGLVPFAARTPIAPNLSISYEAREDATPVSLQEDPWNLWVFRASVGTEVSGESRQSSASIDGSLSASRTTEDVKVDLSLFGEYETEEFELSDSTTITSLTRFYDLEGIIVWSLSPHWSAGVAASATTSTRLNQDLTLKISPAIEYNLYPYAESTRRQILFTYLVGPVRYNYDELTLFEETEETLFQQVFEISAAFQQPWGEIDGSLEVSNYLNDFSKHRIDLFSGIEVRLFRGLGLDVRGNVARIKDQIYIPREDLSDEEILLELRELGTDFEYELEVGFSYSFGSVFNNVVNPRLRLGGGDDNFF
jgi:hypothetical protein